MQHVVRNDFLCLLVMFFAIVSVFSQFCLFFLCFFNRPGGQDRKQNSQNHKRTRTAYFYSRLSAHLIHGTRPSCCSHYTHGLRPSCYSQYTHGLRPSVNSIRPLAFGPVVNSIRPWAFGPVVISIRPLAFGPVVNSIPPLAFGSVMNSIRPLAFGPVVPWCYSLGAGCNMVTCGGRYDVTA